MIWKPIFLSCRRIRNDFFPNQRNLEDRKKSRKREESRKDAKVKDPKLPVFPLGDRRESILAESLIPTRHTSPHHSSAFRNSEPSPRSLVATIVGSYREVTRGESPRSGQTPRHKSEIDLLKNHVVSATLDQISDHAVLRNFWHVYFLSREIKPKVT